jgi:hypothetical protein
VPVLRALRDTLPQREDYIDTGKVRRVFRNLPLESLHRCLQGGRGGDVRG